MMHPIHQSVLLLASVLSSTVLANPVPSVVTSTFIGVPTDGASAPHNVSGAAVINPGEHTAVGKPEFEVLSTGQKCINFKSANPNWHYRMDGPWSGSGQFGSGWKQICMPRSDSAGGAMFIAPNADTPAGSTKLECFFPSQGTANCDVSLVDGYSLSVACTTSKHSTPTIGGYYNLWKDATGCEDQSMVNQGICKNDKGYQGSQAAVTGLFQAATWNGNNYCIWADCSQDYFFSMDEDLNCYVSGGR